MAERIMKPKSKRKIDFNDIEVVVSFVPCPSAEDEAEREDKIISILTESAMRIVKKGLK